MARILFAWEMGGGFGHAGPLRAVADALAKDGHEPVFALRDVVTPAPLFRDRPYPILQAPFWPKPFTLRGRTHALSSFADVLALCGYAQAGDLAAMVRAWDALLDRVLPDLLVIDNAPTLALAAFDRLPVIHTGYGFTLPPAHEDRFPPMRDDTPPLVAEVQLLKNVATVQRARKARVPATLTELFRGRFRALTCVRELDPYPKRIDEEMGPLEPMPAPSPLPSAPSLFVYLGGEFRGLDHFVQALALLDCPVSAFLRDDAAIHTRFLQSRRITAFPKAPPLAEIVPRVRWMLSTAGHTTTHAALMGGRPQILLPLHLETRMTTERLVELGVGRKFEPRGEPADIAKALTKLMADETLPAMAATVAASIADRRIEPGLPRLIAACRELLT